MDRMRRNLAAAACFALLAGACGGGGGSDQKAAVAGKVAARPSVSKAEIKVGAIFDLSGPTADEGTPFSEGIRDYVSYRNGKGGIDGHRIALSWQDYAYKVPQGEQLYSQAVSQGAVAFMGWGTADSEALRPRVTADKVPFMSASYAETLADPKVAPYNFFPGVSYSEQMRIVLKYISDESRGRHAEVAVFHHDSPFGRSPLEDGKKYIADKKLDVGFTAYAMPAGAIDFMGQIAQAKAQKASYIVIQNTATAAARLATNLAESNSTAQIVCLNWSGDEIYTNLAGRAAEGTIGVMPFAPPGAANLEGLRDISDFLQTKNAGVEAKGLRYVQGWFTMASMAQGIENAVRRPGDAKLDGAAIKAGLEKIVGFRTGGVSDPISYSPTNHAGLQTAPLYHVRDGKWVKFADPMKA
jgi:branched-chain amino acid transport system substrate-binding protein